ncbi:restriction endonuclease subunit S [Bacillus pseudomycoides]|uniref:restriction endonuclease subunit S n=1 Tax=Bacillus pseudomycoides TaxID=64104 RepID=UPI00119F9A5B|nr:restriction endonuclease subunit S [Bacillus pseudomycoides]
MENKYTPEIRFSGFTENWEQRKVGDFYFFKNGLNKEKEFFGSGTPIVNFTDVFHNRGLFSKDLKGKVQLTQKEINNYEVQQGDIFFTRTSETIEEIGYPSVMIDNPINTVFSGFVLRGRAIENDPLVLDYKRYVFFTNTFREEMKKKSSMTTRALTSGTAIKEMLFNYPKSKVEQEQIGKLFKQLDDMITLHQQELTTLKQTKQGFLQKMFPKEGEFVPEIRFPGFTGDWEQRKVMDFSEETFGGGTPKTSIKEYWNGEIPWIQSSDLDQHQVSGVFAKKKINEKGLQNSATKLIPKNSIAIVTRVGVGKIALMQFEYATSQDFLSLSNLKVNEWFGVYSLYNQLQKELHNVQGTSIKGITKNELLDKKINIPTNLEEQNKIGKFFKQLDGTIALHQRELNALKETKKAFLQKMFV